MTQPTGESATWQDGRWICKKCGEPVAKTYRRTGDFDGEANRRTWDKIENVPCGDNFRGEPT